jgi:two-component system chemotaxis response regulator CheY
VTFVASGTTLSLAGARLLVAEDSAVAAQITKRTLVEAGCIVRLAEDGAAALALLAEEEFDLLVTDWMMPGIDGLELCRSIRQNERWAGLYVLFLTTFGEKEQIVEGLSAGADDYLCKPFHPGELLARVRAGYRLVGLQRRLRKANSALERLAMTDPLTDLSNRRAFDQLVDYEAAGFARGGPPFCLVRIDLDRFKEVNDTHGHDAGDRLLTGVGEALNSVTRGADAAARIGGDEFALLLRACSVDDAVRACERVRAQISKVRIRLDGEEAGTTASFGIAQAQHGVDPAETLAAADTALYDAKDAGRDRIAVAGEPGSREFRAA